MSRQRWLLIVITCVSVLVCYRHVISGMIEQWSIDEDMGHGFLVPFVIAFVVWRERTRWRQVPLRPSAWGLVLILLGAVTHVMSAVGAGLFAGSVALVISLTGMIVSFGGIPLLRAWRFPLLLLLFMLPKLAIVYNQVTLPLQLLASRMAAGMLTLTGAAVLRSGNILEMAGHQIAVAEACSGIRYLLPLGFLSVVFAYFAESKLWMRVALVASAIPVAILANAVRVAFSAYSPTLAEGPLHALLGSAIFIISLAAFLPIRAALRHLTGVASDA